MAVTFSDIPPGPTAIVALGTVVGKVPGDRRRKRVRVTGDTAYPTGGYAPPSLANLGFQAQIDYCDITNTNGPGSVAEHEWFWNTVTQKLQIILNSTGAELANAQTAAADTCDCVFEGF